MQRYHRDLYIFGAGPRLEINVLTYVPFCPLFKPNISNVNNISITSINIVNNATISLYCTVKAPS